MLPENVRRIEIAEVGPRDGFQLEKEWIPTKEKITIIDKLIESGVSEIELTSFVHPKAIPQLKDAEEVTTTITSKYKDRTDLSFRALVPNLKGAERAIASGLRNLKLMLSATDSHSISNANSKTEDALKGFEPLVEFAFKNNATVMGAISVAFGCPYEGKVPIERLISIVSRYQEMGVKEISLADTSGMGNPLQVYKIVGELRNAFPDVKYSMHLHNTRGMAFANAIAAMKHGVIHFDASIAGLGGCPYAPGATGNIATEDIVHALDEMGLETGINLTKLLNTSKYVRDLVGHDGGSFILKAGPNSRLHIKPSKQEKLG